MSGGGKAQITVRWLKSRRIRITATRGAVTTEATLTEAEATQLAYRLDQLLNGTHGPAVRSKGGTDGG